jgi:hypothetical protein
MLTLAAFRRLAGTYGADLARWPEAQRAEAEALLTTSPAAREILQKAAALDTALDSLALPEPDAEDLARLRAGVAARLSAPVLRSRLPPLPRWSWLTAGASGAVAAGLMVGLLTATPPANTGLLSILQISAVPVLVE